MITFQWKIKTKTDEIAIATCNSNNPPSLYSRSEHNQIQADNSWSELLTHELKTNCVFNNIRTNDRQTKQAKEKKEITKKLPVSPIIMYLKR